MVENERILAEAFPVLELYTPMTKEEYESKVTIVEKVLGEAFGE